MTYSRLYFSGAAVANTLSSAIGASDTTIPVSSALVGWPVSFPFMGVLDKGTASEEKIKITAGTTSLTVSRGQDGTTAVTHANGATLQHCLDSVTVGNHETFVAGNGTVTPSTSAVGDGAADGVSALPAAADHKHAREAFATGASSSSAPGDAAADGTSASPARADHKHSRESVATLASDVLNAQFTGVGQIPVGVSNGSGTLLPPGATVGQALRTTGVSGSPAYGVAPNLSGTLGSDYATTTSFVTFLTTASFGVGTWKVTFNGFFNPGPGGGADVKIAVGTATATFTGPVVTGGVAEAPMTFTTIVTVTAAGTLVYQAQGNAGGGTIKAASPATATAGLTGYTAVQL